MCRQLSTHLKLLPDWKDLPEEDWDPFSLHGGGLLDYINVTLPTKPFDAATQRQMRLDDEARNAARTGACLFLVVAQVRMGWPRLVGSLKLQVSL